MIDVAVDIVKRHLEEYYPNDNFTMRNYAKEYTFYSYTKENARVIVELANDVILYYMSNQVRKKKLLEGQLRLIGAMKYSDMWDYYGYDRNI